MRTRTRDRVGALALVAAGALAACRSTADTTAGNGGGPAPVAGATSPAVPRAPAHRAGQLGGGGGAAALGTPQELDGCAVMFRPGVTDTVMIGRMDTDGQYKTTVSFKLEGTPLILGDHAGGEWATMTPNSTFKLNVKSLNQTQVVANVTNSAGTTAYWPTPGDVSAYGDVMSVGAFNPALNNGDDDRSIEATDAGMYTVTNRPMVRIWVHYAGRTIPFTLRNS